MKKTLLTLISMVLLSTSVFSQNPIFPNGTATAGTKFQGAVIVDSMFRPPVRSLSPIYLTPTPFFGRIQTNVSDNHFYHHNGTGWQQIVNLNQLKDSVNHTKSLIPINNNQLINGSGFLSSVSWGIITGKPTFSPVSLSGDYNDLINRPTLGTAASQNSSAFATSAQGIKADNALQPNGNGSALTGITATQVGLGNVPNVNATIASNIVQNASYRFVTDAEKTSWDSKQSPITLTTTGTGAATFSSNVLNIPTPVQYVPTVYTPTRSLNNNFIISSTRQAEAKYSVSLSVTNPLLIGSSTASAFLEYSINGGSSWVIVAEATNTSSVGITVTVAITNVATQQLNGTIPANALVRVRSTTSGTASVTITTRQQEIY